MNALKPSSTARTCSAPVAQPIVCDYVDKPIDLNFNQFINPFHASHQQAGLLNRHQAGVQFWAQVPAPVLAPFQHVQLVQQAFTLQTTPAPQKDWLKITMSRDLLIQADIIKDQSSQVIIMTMAILMFINSVSLINIIWIWYWPWLQKRSADGYVYRTSKQALGKHLIAGNRIIDTWFNLNIKYLDTLSVVYRQNLSLLGV